MIARNRFAKLCPKCNTQMLKSTRLVQNKTEVKYTCPKCGEVIIELL